MHKFKQFQARLRILISQIIFEEIENDKARNATVTEVKLNKDGSVADVYVTFPTFPEQSILELQKKANFIRRRVAQNIDKKYCPYLKFQLDNLLDQINHWENKLSEVIQKDTEIKKKVVIKKQTPTKKKPLTKKKAHTKKVKE